MGLTTTKEYTWDDSGAPTVNGTAGAARNWLKSCLVTGYGGKSPAGWSVEWEDAGANKIVFRNSQAAGGSGAYLRVDDSNATVTSFQMFEDMTDIDTGTGGTLEYMIVKSSAASGTARPWKLFADERTFYGCVLGDNTSVPLSTWTYLGWTSTFGGGDYRAFRPGDPGVFAFGRRNSGQYYDTDIMVRRATNEDIPDRMSITRDKDLVGNAENAAVVYLQLTGYGSNIGYTNFIGETTYGTAGRHYIKAVIFTGKDTTFVPVGELRGLYLPLNKIVTASTNMFGEIDTPLATHTPMSLSRIIIGCMENGNYGAFAIDRGNWE